MGFSDIESAIYVFLLTDRPSTGYRISHAIGKPTANTYQAISSLERKGAILVDEGDNRICRAVPSQELLSRLDREFQSRRVRAEVELGKLETAAPDQRIYQLKTVEQVFERTRSMLTRAKEIVLLDIFPGPLEVLADAMAETAARGVRVIAKTYVSPELDLPELGDVQVVRAADAERARAVWPGEQISMVVDGSEHLLGLLAASMTSVRQAVWSNSVFLSCMHHNHIAYEVILEHHKTVRGISKACRNAMNEMDDVSLLRAYPPGLSELQNLTVLEEKS